MSPPPARPHVTIAHVLLLVAATAFGLAALRRPSWLAADVLVDLSITMTVAAIIVATCGRGRLQTFWAGYAIASSAYLLLDLLPTFPSKGNSPGHRPSTVRLLDACFEAVPRPEMVSSPVTSNPGPSLSRIVKRASGEVVTVVGTTPNPFERMVLDEYYEQIDEAGYRRLGHSVLALIAGIAGGTFALVVAPKRAEQARNGRPADGPETA